MFRTILKLGKNSNYTKQLVSYQRTQSFATILNPDLTKDRYPVTRGPFSTINDKDIEHFKSILGGSRVVSDSIDKYNVDFFRTVRGSSSLVLKPKTTEDVSKILSYCNNRKLAVCPQGGNTSIVGGSVPVFDEIVLSMELMNQIEKIDELSGILECQAGCILENLEENVSQKGLRMPIDLGAKGSCHIGGNVSTNAGGIRLLRYGNLHGSVVGLEAVKADGTIMDLMSNFKKDNTGYHLKHLFIGSEGTLGIVTKVAIACATAPNAVNVAFLGLESYDAVLKTFLAAKRDMGEILSACEMIDSDSLDCSLNALNVKSPIDHYPFYMLIETSGSRGSHDEEKLMDFLKSSMENGNVLDGTVTSDSGKMRHIWLIREQIVNALIKDDYAFIYDISLPLSHFYEIVPVMKKRVGHLAKLVCGFGHIGDANIHLNVTCEHFTKEIYNLIEPFIYEYISKVRGSISAEHGIGFLKKNYMKYSKTPETISLMNDMKTLMDPNGILNPYKTLRKTY